MIRIKKAILHQIAFFEHRARDWNRTSTSLRTADFESAASTNSATRASGNKSEVSWLFTLNFEPQNLKQLWGCNITTSHLIAVLCDEDIFSCNSILLPAAALFRL